jgi:PAS domain S-box-containing protein
MDAFSTLAMRPRSKVPLEYRMSNKDGQVLYLYSKPAAILEDNLVKGFTMYMQDTTERKQTELAYQESQQMMKAVVETSPSMMVLTDADGRITLFNTACEEITGYKRDEVLGKSLEELFIPEKWKPIVRERFADPYSPKLLEPHENPWLTKKGEERLIEWRCTTIPSPDEDKPFILGIGIDITERRKLEGIMIQSQKMDSLGNLAAGIAHDFNNILTAILTHAELSKRQLDSGNFTPESLGKKLDIMTTACKRAKDLTQKLLGLSRQGKYNPQNIDLNGVVRESVELLEKGFSSTIRYELACMAEAANYVYADATQLLMVVQNLVLNARDAMPDGGKITIATDDVTVDGFSGRFDEIPSGSYVKLTVTDAGTGIPDDVLLRIFEPFFTTKEKGKGTGLGLSMVWGIVKNHHGFIEVRTETGKGSTFEVYLPAVSRKKARQDEHAKAEKERKPKILLVDDEEMIRESAQEYLVSLGYDVLIAPSGKEALKIFKDEDIDLTITDLIMKEMDGPELFKRIREIDPSAKVYVMSGYSQDTKVQGMIAAGAAGFISKPFDLDELEKTVKFALSKK